MTFSHPNPRLERITQIGAALLIAVMPIAAIGQFALVLMGLPVLLFLITGVITLLLIAPVVMLTTATPAVTVAPDGLTIHPLLWRDRFISWREVLALKDYPLLPPKDAEVGRRTFVGRKGYHPAAGIMLIIPSLPVQYRFTGLFAGEGFTGVIALSNRTHERYDELVERVNAYMPPDAQASG